jgi:hypothetical protein
VDTVSWGWNDTDAVDRFLRLDGMVPPGDDPRPLRLVPAPGRSVRLNRRIDGLGTVGAFPGASLLFVEGRARAMEVRDEDHHGLGSVRTLPQVQEQVISDLGGLLGAAPHAPTGLRRADLAGELRFHRGEHGVEILGLLDALHSPLYKTSPVRERGGPGVETAYWRTPQRSVAVLRAYDKGVESGTSPRGERIRIERQLRYRGGRRPTLEQWISQDLGDLYAAPLRAWLRDGVAAGTARQLIELLTDAADVWPNYWATGASWATRSGTVQDGSLKDRRPRAGHYTSLWTARKVERIIGTLAVVDVYGRQWPAWSPKQRQRRMAEVRDLGLLVTDHPVTVDVDQAVNQLCELWRAAA